MKWDNGVKVGGEKLGGNIRKRGQDQNPRWRHKHVVCGVAVWHILRSDHQEYTFTMTFLSSIVGTSVRAFSGR